MCGIAGRINLNKREIKISDLKKMSEHIAHRGPDDEGFFISENRQIGFVNRRLAIIDLSSRGHQPMTYKKRWITFNGEVYNFHSEREKLKKAGYRFKSGTDTEVILALYDKYGTRCLSHLRGMFAFAIYDPTLKIIFLARDRIGKKPLKYYLDESMFAFSSELKAILTQKEVKREPDFLAIHHYLTYGYAPSPMTGFTGIQKLEPGHYMILDTRNGKLSKSMYWRPDLSEKLELSEREWSRKILEELEEATRLRMIADVPVGAFLSGGVDSSGVVALMAKLSKNPVKTFTIGFKEKKYNESEHANRIAKLYKTNHQVLTVEPKAIEYLPQLTYQNEEPFADSSSVITYLVSQMAHKYVTVILNGDGGDENFAGYDRHVRINRDSFVDNFNYLKPSMVNLLSILDKYTKSDLIKKSYKFLKKSKLPLSSRYVSYNRYFSNSDKRKLYTDYLSANTHVNAYGFANKMFEKSKVNGPDQGLYFDLCAYLPEDLLAKVDIASMANSLEARSPFLDHKVIELAAQIPYRLKVKGRETKYILKKAFEGLVPKENLYRQKMGFSVPLDKWFTGKLSKYTESKLLRKSAKTKSLFNKDEIKRMLSNHTEQNDFGPRLWSLLTLELWMENYFN